MTQTMLRDLVERELDQSWESWAAQHPNLAAAIGRTTLSQQAVDALRDDPEFQSALTAAGLDEAKLAAAARVLEMIKKAVSLAVKAI
jgi:hypothetical protein